MSGGVENNHRQRRLVEPSPIIEQMRRDQRRQRQLEFRKQQRLYFIAIAGMCWWITSQRQARGLDPIPPAEWFD